MQVWEYLTLAVWLEKDKWIFQYNGRKYPESERNTVQNELGKQGWELVTVLPFQTHDTTFGTATSPSYTSSYTLFFKRAKA